MYLRTGAQSGKKKRIDVAVNVLTKWFAHVKNNALGRHLD